MPVGSRRQAVATERFFRRIPPKVTATFTPSQIRAIAKAVYDRPGQGPAVNIRVSVPLLFGRVYIAVLAGRERRSRQRLREERAANPLATAGNLVFMIVAALVFYGAIGALALFYLSTRLPGF